MQDDNGIFDPDVEQYCSRTQCINCEGPLARRTSTSGSTHIRKSDYIVSRKRIEVYSSLRIRNNPFHLGLLSAPVGNEPKLCSSCEKKFRAYEQISRNSLGTKRLASQRDGGFSDKLLPKSRKVGSVLVQLDGDYNILNDSRKKGASVNAQFHDEESKETLRFCLICCSKSHDENGATGLRMYNAKIGREMLESIEEDRCRFLKLALRQRFSNKGDLTVECILQALVQSTEFDSLCGACIQAMKRQRDRVDEANCSVCKRSVEKRYLHKLLNARILNDDEHFVLSTIIRDMLRLRLDRDSWQYARDEGDPNIYPLVEGTHKVCDACRVFSRRFVRRCLDQHADKEKEHRPATCFDRVVMWLDYELKGPGRMGTFKNMTDVYNLYRSVVEIAWESQTGAEGQRTVMSYRTFKDAIISLARFSVVTETMMPDGRRGACICSERTLRNLLAVGLKHHKSDVEESLSPQELFSDLGKLAKRYKKLRLTRNTSDPPIFDLVEEIECVPPRLWTFWIGFLSSRRLRNERKLLLQQHDGDVTRLPFPHNNQCGLNRNMLDTLPQHDYRRVIRVLVAIQVATYTLDQQAVGPIVWSLSCALASKGSNKMLRLCNAAGFTIHPNTFRHLKESVLAYRRSLPLSQLVRSGTFSAFAFDNIDAELAVNAIADGSRPKQFHGTALIAEQPPHLLPMTSRKRYTALPQSIAHPADMLKLTEYDEQTLRESKALLLGIVACFGEQLLTTRDDQATTVGFLVRHFLQGYSRRSRALVEHILFLNAPSNNSSTVRTVLDSIRQAASLHKLPDGVSAQNPYVTVTADEPLYQRMIQILYGGGPPGSRNRDFENIIPLPGGLHFLDMGLCDIVKRLCFYAFMNGIVPLSGLPDGAAKRFCQRKDPKTTHRVFEQVAAATIRRIVDALLESGHLSRDQLPPFEHGRSGRSYTDVMAELMRRQQGRTDRKPIALHMNSDFPGREVELVGQRILEAAERRAQEAGEHQFRHFALELVICMLLPCVMVRYLGRAGQTRQRHALVKSMGTSLYVSAKVKYHRVMMHYLCELERMPPDLRECLMSTEYSTVNLSGTNSHGNQDVDEVMEETGIKRTKEGAYIKTEKALEQSFHSTGFLNVGHQWLFDIFWRRKTDRQHRVSNFEKRLACGASKMYVHLCGGSGATIWLGNEHRAESTLTNVTVTPHIRITTGQQTKLQDMQSVARHNMQIVALRSVPEFIQRATQDEMKAARKGKLERLEFFKEAYNTRCKSENRIEKAAVVKQKRSSVVSAIWKSRAAEMKAIGQQLSEAGTSEMVRTRCRNRLQLISQHVDLMTGYPEAFMDSTGTTHHPSRKAGFWSAKVKGVLKDLSHQVTVLSLT